MKHVMTILFVCLLQLVLVPTVLAQNSEDGSTAKVIFYRSTQDSGKAYSLTSQNQELAKLKKGEKFEQTLAPGTYYYMADPSTKQVFKLDAVAGQVYYILASRDGNFFNGQPTLQITTAQEYQRDLANNE